MRAAAVLSAAGNHIATGSDVTKVGVTPGAVADGVTLFTSKSDDLFSHRPTDYRHHFCPLK